MDDTIALMHKNGATQEQINIFCSKGIVKSCNEKPYLLITEE